jgi:hypothetical protein
MTANFHHHLVMMAPAPGRQQPRQQSWPTSGMLNLTSGLQRCAPSMRVAELELLNRLRMKARKGVIEQVSLLV